jgi:hypothetical protein
MERVCNRNNWSRKKEHKYDSSGRCYYCRGTHKENRLRTLTEILVDADNATCPEDLMKLIYELGENQHQYPRVQIAFGKEHLKERIQVIKDEILLNRM